MLNRVLDLIAPEVCLECNNEGSVWCDPCRLQYEPLPSRCFICHKQTKNYQTCKNCYSKTRLRSVYIFGEYSGLNKNLIKALKYGNKRHASLPIAKAMAQTLPYFANLPTVVNVPTSPSRVRQRGFDHTQTLAKELAKQLDAKYLRLLVRNNDLRQVGATRKQRISQISGAFRLKAYLNTVPEHIILVDDVITTGATLAEATRVLKQAGVKQVDALVFAYSK